MFLGHRPMVDFFIAGSVDSFARPNSAEKLFVFCQFLAEEHARAVKELRVRFPRSDEVNHIGQNIAGVIPQIFFPPKSIPHFGGRWLAGIWKPRFWNGLAVT